MTETVNVTVTRTNRVGVITLNRPERLNALSLAVINDVVRSATELDRDKEIGAIVLTGAGRTFAAGADITKMSSATFMDMYLTDWYQGWDAFASVRTPVIAAVNGYALGGGCELAMMCDIVIASDEAKFGQPEIKLGVTPGMGGSQRLTRAVGKAKAMDMILTGRYMWAPLKPNEWAWWPVSFPTSIFLRLECRQQPPSRRCQNPLPC